MKNIDLELKKLIDYLIENYKLEAIILFGSYARNTQNGESDIDIAIKQNEDNDLRKMKNEIEDMLHIDVDLINLDEINDSFRYEILINGKILYCKDELSFELYRLDMYREYLELNEMRQQIIQNIKNGGDIYGK